MYQKLISVARLIIASLFTICTSSNDATDDGLHLPDDGEI